VFFIFTVNPLKKPVLFNRIFTHFFRKIYRAGDEWLVENTTLVNSLFTVIQVTVLSTTI